MTPCLRPRTLDAALTARSEHPDWLVLAGGTDVMVGVLHRPAPRGVLDLFGLPGLTGIEVGADAIRIGAGVTYAQLLREPRIGQALPALWRCAREVGALQIQERGTLGGNVGTSSPVGDTLPVLLALDAEVELASIRGRRRLAYREFLTGYRRTALAADELIVAVVIPRPDPRAHQFWRKVGTRKAQAISKVMAAGVARLDGRGRMRQVRLAMGAVADRPIRLEAVEELLEGQVPDARLAAEARMVTTETLAPITDVRSTEAYRREVAGNLAGRFVLELAGGGAA